MSLNTTATANFAWNKEEQRAYHLFEKVVADLSTRWEIHSGHVQSDPHGSMLQLGFAWKTPRGKIMHLAYNITYETLWELKLAKEKDFVELLVSDFEAMMIPEDVVRFEY